MIWRKTAGPDLPAGAAPERVYLNDDSHAPGARAMDAVFAGAVIEYMPVTDAQE